MALLSRNAETMFAKLSLKSSEVLDFVISEVMIVVISEVMIGVISEVIFGDSEQKLTSATLQRFPFIGEFSTLVHGGCSRTVCRAKDLMILYARSLIARLRAVLSLAAAITCIKCSGK